MADIVIETDPSAVRIFLNAQDRRSADPSFGNIDDPFDRHIIPSVIDRSFGGCAVLYRTNAQSRMLEERFIMKGIPYQVVGGVNFYARREIKD